MASVFAVGRRLLARLNDMNLVGWHNAPKEQRNEKRDGRQ
jgi:hypothetical protein